jgi:hypothetical protein
MFKRVWAILAGALIIVAATAGSASAAWPQFGISQSFRNFGLKVDEGPYNASKDVTKSTFWAPLNVQRLRVIVPFDLAFRSPTDGRRQEFQHWLNTANELGAEPYVVFGPTELTTNVVDAATYPKEIFRTPTDTTPPIALDSNELVAPLVATYRTAIGKFMDTWGPGTAGNVRLFGAWNEPNVEEVSQILPGGAGSARVYLPANSEGGYSSERSMGNPRSAEEAAYSKIHNCEGSSSTWTVYNCGPRMAAYYWYYAVQEIIARSAKCSEGGLGCKIVAGEFASRARHLWYWDKYASQIESISALRPVTISFHGHNDADPLTGTEDDCKTGGLKSKCITTSFYEWLKAEPGVWPETKIWDTEVGARHEESFGSPSSADVAQKNRFLHLIEISEEAKVERLYYFNFAGTGTDRGLIDPEPTLDSRARPIWTTVKCRPGMPAC